MFVLGVEFVFMYFGATFIWGAWNKNPCDASESDDQIDNEDQEEINAHRVIATTVMLACIHLYNVIRICHRILVKVKNIKEKASMLKCFLVDCYFLIALVCFIIAQNLYFNLLQSDHCMKVRYPTLSGWL